MVYSGKDRRQRRADAAELEPVVLKKKLAEALNGISLAGFKVGDRLAVAPNQATILIAEGWACPVPPEQRRRVN